MSSPFSERKILAHLPILNAYVRGDWYPPIQVELDLTNLCSSDCPWCSGYTARKQNGFSLTTQRAIDLISEIADLGAKSITFTGGGDPTLHTEWIRIVEWAYACELDVGLITNGVVSVVDVLPWCQWIRFSVDAATKESYGRQHGKPQHWERVLDNVAAAARMKDDNRYGVTLGVGFVAHHDVVADIEPFVKLWQFIGVDYIQFRPIMDTTEQQLFERSQEVLDAILRAEQLDPRVCKSEAKFRAMLSGESGKTKYCHGTFLETAIAADGSVYACCHLKGDSRYSLGSIYEERFEEIWKRHISCGEFPTTPQCMAFCRHYGTNKFIEDEVVIERKHENFI